MSHSPIDESQPFADFNRRYGPSAKKSRKGLMWQSRRDFVAPQAPVAPIEIGELAGESQLEWSSYHGYGDAA